MRQIRKAAHKTFHVSAEKRLAIQFAVSQLLIESKDPGRILPEVLRTIGEGFGWDYGGYWAMETESRALRCLYTWHRTGIKVKALVLQNRFQLGEGLPGRLWRSGKPVWIVDLQKEKSLLRFETMSEAGLRWAVAFCVPGETGMLGVIEFCSRGSQPLNAGFRQAFITLGNQVGQYIDPRKPQTSPSRK